MSDDKEPPVVDLHPSEWSKVDSPQPFLGANGAYVLIMFALGFPVSALATLLITGELPYWLQHLLQ